MRLRAASDYDPDGDDSEHPESIAAATDGNATTYWTTETYGSFDKSGVGIVVRASAPVDGGTVVVRSDDDAGYTAEIRASTRPGGGFETVSESQTVGPRTTFELDTAGEEYRFLLVWITELGPGGRAHVNEVALRSWIRATHASPYVQGPCAARTDSPRPCLRRGEACLARAVTGTALAVPPYESRERRRDSPGRCRGLRLEPEAGPAVSALDGQLHQPVEELRVRDP